MNKILTLAVAILFLLPIVALAQTQEERSATVTPDCRISIKNVAGSIEVQGWDQNQVHLNAILGPDVTRLDFLGGDRSVQIAVVVPHRGNHHIDSTLTLSVPRGSRLFIEAVSADVGVHDVGGEIEASAVSGKVRIDNAQAPVRAKSVSGDVSISANSPTLSVNTISGDMAVSGAIDELRIETVSGKTNVSGTAGLIESRAISGDISISGAATTARMETVSGDIQLDRAIQEIQASTISGRVQIAGERLMVGRISSTSGNITVTADMAETGRFDATSQSGSITLRTAENPAVRFDASTMSGNIKSTFGAPQKVAEHGPGLMLRAGPPQATAVISLETTSGSIAIERK